MSPRGVPAAIENALYAAAVRHLPDTVTGGARLTAAVIERSRRYTSDRDELAAPLPGLAGDADLAARALFFTIADAPKASFALAELGDHLAWHGAAPLRVLDLGAGAGAMTLGALVHAAAIAATRPLAIDALDRDTGALAILADAVAAAAAALGITATVTTRRGDVTRPIAGGPYDLVLLGSVLNELDDDVAAAVARSALGAAAPAGAVVIVEPALRACARALHRVRDSVIGGGWGQVFAPCTRRAVPCPMLADERDWCHEERPSALPPRAARIAQVTGLRDGALKFSYLTLRHADGHVGGGEHTVRVVGHPHRSKGKLETQVCGDGGLVELRLLSRHRGDHNRAFEHARRGEVLHIVSSLPLSDGLGPDATVARVGAPTPES